MAAAIVLLFGPPGVGKGTQATQLAGFLGVPHISTGEMLRQALLEGTELGLKAGSYMNRGELVPDELVFEMLADRIAREDASRGFLLDGFPRTIPQAEALRGLLEKLRRRVDAVLVLEAQEAILVARIAGRRTCGSCEAPFHVEFRPPRIAGRCDLCGGTLTQRTDDTEASVRRRLQEYRDKTEPLMRHFERGDWPLRRIDASGDIDEVRRAVRSAIAS